MNANKGGLWLDLAILVMVAMLSALAAISLMT
jgi:hypothetical protein